MDQSSYRKAIKNAIKEVEKLEFWVFGSERREKLSREIEGKWI